MKHLAHSALLAALTLAPTIASAGDVAWPAFRGANGVASTKADQPPVAFTPADALWKTELPPGSSSPFSGRRTHHSNDPHRDSVADAGRRVRQLSVAVTE